LRVWNPEREELTMIDLGDLLAALIVDKAFAVEAYGTIVIHAIISSMVQD
jgi:hypothetical protein